MKSIRRLLAVSAALCVGMVAAHAQALLPSVGGSMLVQRKQTLAAFDFHWAWNSKVGLTLGLGCTYDVAESFKLSNLTSNSVGLLAGIQVRF